MSSGYILGDANGDGVVDVLDSTIIQRVIARVKTLNYNEKAADIDGNGMVDVTGVTLLQRALARIDVPYNVNGYVSESIEAPQEEYELHIV